MWARNISCYIRSRHFHIVPERRNGQHKRERGTCFFQRKKELSKLYYLAEEMNKEKKRSNTTAKERKR